MNSLIISNVSPIAPHSNHRLSENLQFSFDDTKQRQTIGVFKDIEERTPQKAPIYREIEVPMSERRP